MSHRPCDICERPIWDGGHALNERECNKSGGEVCMLWQTVKRQANALIQIRKNEVEWKEGRLTNGERDGLIRDWIRRGLDESIPAHTLFIQSWCGGETSEYAKVCADRNKLIAERDALQAKLDGKPAPDYTR